MSKSWKEDRRRLDFQLDMLHEGCLARLELLKKLELTLKNETDTIKTQMSSIESAQGDVSILKTEKLFREYCDLRATWDPLYSIGMSEKTID